MSRLTRLLFATLVVGLVTTTCGGSNARSEKTAFLESLFPSLVEEGFRGLWYDSECRFLAIQGRSFTSDPSLCTVGYDSSMGPLGAFDEAASARLDELAARFRQGNVDLTVAAMDLEDGAVAGGSFFVDGPCDAYVYEPGWTSLPIGYEEDPNSAAAIDDDWYWTDFCS